MSRVLRIVLAGMLILAVTTFASANCLPDNIGKSAEMACPNDGQHDCCPSLKAADCCTSSAASTETFTAVTPVSVKPIVALSFVPAAVPLASSSHRLSSLSAPISLTPSPPIFLLASSLRI